ncbi:hypothetical protein Ancab_015504 [Ancistrocladus abbreviatus]
MGTCYKRFYKKAKIVRNFKEKPWPPLDVSNMKSNPTFDMAPDKPTSSHIMKNGGLEPVNSTPSPDKPRPMVLDLNCLNLAKGISHEASDGNLGGHLHNLIKGEDNQ